LRAENAPTCTGGRKQSRRRALLVPRSGVSAQMAATRRVSM
jgi:hypothetical protein